MPIAFPVLLRGPYFDRPDVMFSPKVLNYVPATNMSSPGKPLIWLDFGMPRTRFNLNVRELSKQYRNVCETSIVNSSRDLDEPGVVLTDLRIYDRTLGTSRLVLTGVSYDISGNILGGCTIKLFRKDNDAFVMSTVSNGSGNWSMEVMVGGPFYLVEYKVGAPDVFGTSPNNIVPVVV